MPALPLIWRVVAVLAALAAVLGIVAYGVGQIKKDGAAQAQAREAIAAAQAASAAQAETARRVAQQEGIAHDAQVQADAARADAAAARTAADRLRQRVSAADRLVAAYPRASATSAPADTPPGVPAEDVLSGLLDLAGRYAADADAARTAGLACEHSYEALTVPPAGS